MNQIVINIVRGLFMNHVVMLVIKSKVLGACEPLGQEPEGMEISVLFFWVVLRVHSTIA